MKSILNKKSDCFPTYQHPAWIEINLSQFRKNIEIIRNYIGKRLYCLPIKANAYGHGLCPIGKAAEAAGVDYLAVAHLQEGVALRNAGVRIPILILGAIHEDQILPAIDWDLEFTISSRFKAELAKTHCKAAGKRCRVHIEVDTGMQRTGMRRNTAEQLIRDLQGEDWLEIIGVYSHFATADEFTSKQIEAFGSLATPFPCIRHLSNSSGISFFPEAHLDMVRPSLITFGYLPPNAPAALQGIAPCFSLKAKVSYFKVVEAGAGISYGHTHTTSRQTRIVTIPVGYGDGFRRALSNKGSVLIRGKQFPIVGTICMDQFMVDVGDQEVYVGDEVVLIGKQGSKEISLIQIATLLDTIPYEVLCLFNERIPRIYHDH